MCTAAEPASPHLSSWVLPAVSPLCPSSQSTTIRMKLLGVLYTAGRVYDMTWPTGRSLPDRAARGVPQPRRHSCGLVHGRGGGERKEGRSRKADGGRTHACQVRTDLLEMANLLQTRDIGAAVSVSLATKCKPEAHTQRRT